MISLGFKITVDIDGRTTKILDVTLDLIRRKIDKKKNTLSTNAKVFDESKPVYEAALKQSHHPGTLTFKPKPHPNKTTKKTRRRECIFDNPPYFMSIRPTSVRHSSN